MIPGKFAAAILAVSLSAIAHAQSVSDQPEKIAGVWRGNSVCVVRDSPCHDETNLYRISSIPEKPNAFQVTGSKIVDGKEIVMGTGEWTYDSSAHVLAYASPAGTFRLTIMDRAMEGQLTLIDGTAFRHISLHREN